VHSRYVRRIADLPWADSPVRVNAVCRKFFCDWPDCPCVVFVERLGDVVGLYARRTERLSQLISALGLLAGGAAGRRIAEALGLSVSSDTVLRQLRRQDTAEAPTPRVLGVDDWAFKRGMTYGTILVDLERRKAVDVLNDRGAESLAQWLRQHPGVEIISRDRGGPYAEGARAGAPNALQVADRWHLLKNLFAALGRSLQHHSADLRDAAVQAAGESQTAADPCPARAGPAHDPGAKRAGTAAALGRRRARLAEIHSMQAAGKSLREIARATGLARATVRRYSAWEELPASFLAHPRRRRCLDPWAGYIRERLDRGACAATRLHRDLREQGFRGSVDTVQRYVADLRRTDGCPSPRARGSPAGHANPVPTVRAATWLLLKDDQGPFEDRFRDRLFERCPVLQEAVRLVREFWDMLRARSSDGLSEWRAAVAGKRAELPEIAGFSQGLEQDIDAVRAAFSIEWSNGQTEGQVNRLKMIKRRAFGRASFDLLRAWVLAPA
jgi:transposase